MAPVAGLKNSCNLSPEEYISKSLGIRALKNEEMAALIETFEEKVKDGLAHPKTTRPGPMMVRSYISPPETDPVRLVGKKAIGIDIGGTNLRMGVGEINNQRMIDPLDEPISREVSKTYDSLDDFFQMLLNNGLARLLNENPDLPLACIFSFSGSGEVVDNNIDMIIGEGLSKGWVIADSAGKKLGEELNIFLERKVFKKRKYLIDNDTIALIKDKQTDMGVVCASGYNWSVVVDKSQLGESPQEPGKTIINTESGSANVAPVPEIVSRSLIPKLAKEQNLKPEEVPIRDEYQVSGMYLGKILSMAVIDLKQKFNIFHSVPDDIFFKKSFVVSDILAEDWETVRERFGITDQQPDFSGNEKKLLVQIATALRDRSAQIVAGHLIGLHRMIFPDKEKVVIASDGPIIHKMPGWMERFQQEIDKAAEFGIEISETPYQGQMRDYRGIFDVMYQTIELFSRN